ncbi:MAG: preprotein translocase subunit SecE [Candidatus Gracilibacteria bacterium]|nr:preprotein translocase subunit SecE [Candidatus Gracilibacteria bacterium]
MLQFIKDSVREFKHVVWPTSTETKNYFYIVVTILTLFGLYLFIANNVFSEILLGAKELTTPEVPQIEISDISTEPVIESPEVPADDVVSDTETDTLSGATTE